RIVDREAGGGLQHTDSGGSEGVRRPGAARAAQYRALRRRPLPARRRDPCSGENQLLCAPLGACEVLMSENARCSDTPIVVRPWWREPWPWILMAGPALAVIGCIITIVITMTHFADQAI